MPVTTPPDAALAEFLGATTRHTRRIEIYEADGVTRWAGDTVSRLKDGTVGVDYTRDERRSLDLTLDNSDDGLVNAPGQFWYDKIIKAFRGVQINQSTRLPKVLVISDNTTAPHATAFRAALVALGFGDVRINVLASVYSVDVAPYDIIVSLGGTDSKGGLLNTAYQAGKSVFVVREASEQFFDAMFGTTWAGSTLTSATGGTIAPISISHPLTMGWTGFTRTANAGVSYKSPQTTTANITGIAFNTGSTGTYAITSSIDTAPGRFVGVHFRLTSGQYTDPQFMNFMLTAFNWLNPVVPLMSWETQVGEFMIDRIVQPNRPRELQITCRDYTKKCMLSKFAMATQFAAGQTLEALIAAISGNAGIVKKILPVTGIIVGQVFAFDRGTSRWDAMKQMCTAYNYEIYFDATGYLVIRPFRDPTTTPPVLYIETGKQGQVASYSKSTSDTSLFNHILVSGESSDSTTVPVYAEAINTDPNSNTSVAKIGDRYFEYTSAFITTTAQAQALANTYLSIYSLEEFELDFETLLLPWLEVGDIIGWIDPNPAPGDPSTFLLSSLNFPLGLGTMSSVAKRTTIVS